MKASNRVILIGDGIENPFNVDAMVHAADMFATSCLFHNPMTPNVPSVSCEHVSDNYSPVIALENWKNAHSLYGFQLPAQAQVAVIAGNERRGISRNMANVATQALSIPMISKRMNCINVAAASAVALYYLSYGFKGKMQIRKELPKKRPEILLVSGSDHAELGSAIRSAAAFGWSRAFIEDRYSVWFGCNRVKRSEGRAAARRGRNPIRLIPCKPDHQYFFREAVIVTTADLGISLPKVDICRGPQQVVIIPDESEIKVQAEHWDRVADKVTFAQIQLPVKSFAYHYRHLASITLAEISRQVGLKSLWKPTRQEPLYESSLKLLSEDKGEEVLLEDLADY